MWQERTSHLSKFDQTGREKEKGGKIERDKRERKRRGERGSSFSLVFLEIRSLAFVGAKDKVRPHQASNRDQNSGIFA